MLEGLVRIRGTLLPARWLHLRVLRGSSASPAGACEAAPSCCTRTRAEGRASAAPAAMALSRRTARAPDERASEPPRPRQRPRGTAIAGAAATPSAVPPEPRAGAAGWVLEHAAEAYVAQRIGSFIENRKGRLICSCGKEFPRGEGNRDAAACWVAHARTAMRRRIDASCPRWSAQDGSVFVRRGRAHYADSSVVASAPLITSGMDAQPSGQARAGCACTAHSARHRLCNTCAPCTTA